MITQPPVLSAFADECSQNFSEQLEAVTRNNISHIEIRGVDDVPIHKHSLESVRSMKKKADAAGIAFSAVGSPLGKCCVDGNMEEQVALCRNLVEIAHILETPYIRMFSFRIPRGMSPEECRQQVIDNLGALIDVVSGTGVVLAHENEKHIYGETARRCYDLYETFYSTGVFKGVFDFANFIQAGENPIEDCWPLLKDYTEYFHIKDALLADRSVVPAGAGDGSIKQILGEALENGFTSFLTVEPHLGPKFGESPAVRFECAATAIKNILNEETYS